MDHGPARQAGKSAAFRSVAAQTGIGRLQVTHPSFVDSPGAIAKVSSVLFSKNVNIVEMTTSKATIAVFLPESRLGDAARALSQTLALEGA